MQPRRVTLPVILAVALAAVTAAPAAYASLGRTTATRTAPRTRAATSPRTGATAANQAALRRVHATAAAVATDRPYTLHVLRGDTLSGIAHQVYGHAADWPVIYWANRHRIRWADQLTPGQPLRIVPLPRHVPRPPAMTSPAPPPAPAAASSPSSTASVPPAPVTSGGSGVGGAFGACVRQAENGGSYAWGTGDGGGAYQFEPGTWAAYGGNPADWGSASPAEQDRVFSNAIAAGGQGNWSAYDGCSAGLSTTSARTGATRSSPPVHLLALMRAWVGHRGWHALEWAKSHARGVPYVWGGSGPGGYDCSGLVMAAYGHAVGRWLPHSTYSMLSSGMLVPARHPRPGYLAFFGSGHVELYLAPGWTFGAHHSGTVVGPRRYNAWWHPTAYYRLA